MGNHKQVSFSFYSATYRQERGVHRFDKPFLLRGLAEIFEGLQRNLRASSD